MVKQSKGNENTSTEPIQKEPKFYATITGFFVAVLLISNIASSKILNFGPFTFDGGTILFPLSYIFGDILTEVYGYRLARKVIWTGFFSAVIMSLTLMVVGALQPAAGWENQAAFDAILGVVPRIAIASLIAYFAGEFTNSFVLAKMKIMSKGKHLWQRTIGSTILGEGIDTALFVIIAFFGILPFETILLIAFSNYIFKVGVEIALTPITYSIISFLKKEEKLDHYDIGTDFSPFKV